MCSTTCDWRDAIYTLVYFKHISISKVSSDQPIWFVIILHVTRQGHAYRFRMKSCYSIWWLYRLIKIVICWCCIKLFHHYQLGSWMIPDITIFNSDWMNYFWLLSFSSEQHGCMVMALNCSESGTWVRSPVESDTDSIHWINQLCKIISTIHPLFTRRIIPILERSTPVCPALRTCPTRMKVRRSHDSSRSHSTAN